MSHISKIKLVVLWEHELREAARRIKALNDAWDAQKEKGEGEDEVLTAMLGETIRACHVALYHLVENPEAGTIAVLDAAKAKKTK